MCSGPAQQQPVHHAEHRRVRADAQRQRQDHKPGEQRLPAQAAHGVAEILLEGFHPFAELHGALPVMCVLLEVAARGVHWSEPALGLLPRGVG